MLLFEWDPNKARRNLKIHGVSFDEACTAFKDTLSSTIHDPLHSDEEDRFILIGNSSRNRLLVVVHPPTQETTALAVEECVTVDANSISDGSNRLRRISLTGG